MISLKAKWVLIFCCWSLMKIHTHTVCRYCRYTITTCSTVTMEQWMLCVYEQEESNQGEKQYTVKGKSRRQGEKETKPRRELQRMQEERKRRGRRKMKTVQWAEMRRHVGRETWKERGDDRRGNKNKNKRMRQDGGKKRENMEKS